MWSTVGSLIGLKLTDIYMKKSGKQSIIVWVLVGMLGFSTFAVPTFGGL